MRPKERVEAIENMRKQGFSLTTEEFLRITMGRILKQYGVKEPLDANDYYWLMEGILELCAENDLKEMGLEGWVGK